MPVAVEEITRTASPRRSVSLRPATMPCCARRRALPHAQARESGPRRPVRSSTCVRTSPDSGRRAARPGSCWRRNTWRPDGNVDRDQRDARFEILRCDGGRYRFVGLKFDDEIDLFLDQVLRVAQRHLGLIPVVDNDELEALAFGGAKQPRVHLTGETSCLVPATRTQCGTAFRGRITAMRR